MEFGLKAYTLAFTHPFALAHGTRYGTEAVFLRLCAMGKTGYGEATFPPYLHLPAAGALKQLQAILQNGIEYIHPTAAAFTAYVDAFNLPPFTRNILANALADLNARLQNISPAGYLGIKGHRKKNGCTFTLTRGDSEHIHTKLQTAGPFTHLKLKLDGQNDLAFVQEVKRHSNKPFCVDANQGWEKLDDETVQQTALALKALGCELLEQPFAAGNHQRHRQLKALGILPVFADEGIQDIQQLRAHGNCYDGINLKILKCGGLDRAVGMAHEAAAQSLQLIIGCMSESACGCATALALQSYAAYLDLDGPWLIANNPFTGLHLENGAFFVDGTSGIGVEPLSGFF